MKAATSCFVPTWYCQTLAGSLCCFILSSHTFLNSSEQVDNLFFHQDARPNPRFYYYFFHFFEPVSSRLFPRFPYSETAADPRLSSTFSRLIPVSSFRPDTSRPPLSPSPFYPIDHHPVRSLVHYLSARGVREGVAAGGG